MGRGGTGSLAVTDQATINAIAVSVGRVASGFGTLTVDNASLNLSGQQTAGTLAGANLSIGLLGGTGTATITNGSVVTISNPSGVASLNLGGTPSFGGGSGVLTVNNSQINVTAAPGLALARIGHDGTGIATFTGSTLNVGNPTADGADGSLIVAGQPGSIGMLTLNAGSVVNAGYVGVGMTTAGAGGAATLMLNNSIINATTVEIGTSGLLSGHDGEINATGDVIVAGTISPGTSPGRVTINCNLIALPGSMFIIDILGSTGDFSFDQLRIGDDSTFTLKDLSIVFNFLDKTDPNAFMATGGFDMDNFIQSLNLQTGEVTGLSNVFAPGQTWSDVLGAENFTAVSRYYDLSDLNVAADGTVTVIAVPVPEPSTWAMLLLGLFIVGSMARRHAPLRLS